MQPKYFFLLSAALFWAACGNTAPKSNECRPAAFFEKNMPYVTEHRFQGTADASTEFVKLEQGIGLEVKQTCAAPRTTLFEIHVYDNYENEKLDYVEEAAYYFYQIAGISPEKLNDLEQWSEAIGSNAKALADGRVADVNGFDVSVTGSVSAQELLVNVVVREKE